MNREIEQKQDRIKQKYIGVIIMISLLIGVSALIMGGYKVVQNQHIRAEYEQSDLVWKQEMAQGLDENHAGDIQGQILSDCKRYLQIETEIRVVQETTRAEARIANAEMNSFNCMVQLIDDATGEMVYESGLIAPGYYIETVQLNKLLEPGIYPCTVLWNLYTDGGEHAGEIASMAVIVVGG